MTKVYKNSTELMQLHGAPIYMQDMVDACLLGRLNLFLQGDTGSGKTQLAKDTMNYFPEKSLFILGRNDMDTRELFQQINLEKLREGKTTSELKELTDKINTNLIVVDELPNCVPAVRAQLFNLFDGLIEINGKAYQIGNGYSVGIATGNIGQKFTESSNDLGRALKDRMHVTLDIDYFHPTSYDTLKILSKDTNPRVDFNGSNEALENKVLIAHKEVSSKEISFEKLIAANYLIHGLDYCENGKSKRKMKEAWPNEITSHGQGSDEALILPVSVRGAKSILRLSEAFDYIAKEKGASEKDIKENSFDSVVSAFKFVGAYSGILNDIAVRENYFNDKYSAIDAVIQTAKTQFEEKSKDISAGFEMIHKGKKSQKVLDLFNERWEFMKNTLENSIDKQNKSDEKKQK